MLQFYLTTVAIWLIILYALAFVCEDAIKENGWLENNKKPKSILQGFLTAVALSAIPVFRVIIAITILMMACKTKEEVCALKEETE